MTPPIYAQLARDLTATPVSPARSTGTCRAVYGRCDWSGVSQAGPLTMRSSSTGPRSRRWCRQTWERSAV